ncbi:MAG: hypothetical protein IJ689_07285 [Alphaproteobacteria bacterium]|nr:hypothetical protein [Alphaproteobacteria bacterium]
MNKYILMLGVAGVALGSYAAYASNSATMTVTATIAHDVSLTTIRNINLGTITVNPAATEYTEWDYFTSGKYSLNYGDGIVSADDETVGIFTANIPNPSDCEGIYHSCGGLILNDSIDNIFGGNDNSNMCATMLSYSGTENIFNLGIGICSIGKGKISSVTPGAHEGTITISYTAS